ncbi:MAG: alpha/beta fold hydrolase [Anaerolineales bacterium]|nr:alpha/beta fold hydrolase [Anaerolineales bacterium]
MPKVKIDDLTIYYELHGSEEDPVLVLNNGIIMNAATSWVFQTETLSRHYRVLQYDCRGQGQTDHPSGPYSMESHSDDLAGLLDALEIDQAHIAGISYGGEVAQAFALQHPTRTMSLILADTVSEVGPQLRMIIQGWIDALESKDPDTFFHATVPWNFSASFISANPALLKDARKRYGQLDFPAVIRLCRAFLEVDFTSRLKEVTQPVCILVGEKDWLKGIDYAEILQANIPKAELHLIPGAGHASCWENPAIFNSIILGFLAKYH